MAVLKFSKLRNPQAWTEIRAPRWLAPAEASQRNRSQLRSKPNYRKNVALTNSEWVKIERSVPEARKRDPRGPEASLPLAHLADRGKLRRQHRKLALDHGDLLLVLGAAARFFCTRAAVA